MTADSKTQEWLKSSEYLPPFMRDFHDQKDLFKALDEVVQNRKDTDSYTRDISWVAAQVYTVDIFLWMMAKNGYTLQRARKRVGFNDIYTWVAAAKRRWQSHFASVMGLTNLADAHSKNPPEAEHG